MKAFTKLSPSKFLISAGLFLLALAPRLPDLGRFLTADEFLWVDRSRNFLAALTHPAYRCDSVVEQWNFVAEGLACTLRTGHPGVTTMWTGSFGFLLRWLADGRPGSLHDYVVAVSTNPLDAGFIAPERLGTVLLVSLWVVAVYWLVRRLWGGAIALTGTLLIALDPFHIALSRVIHHDALSTVFMTLSVLAMFIYWGQSTGRRWLALSGVLAGLAFISKIASMYLMPFVALVGLWFTLRKVERRRLRAALPITVFDGLLWFAAAVAIIVIIWPAMWVAPLETVETVYLLGFKYATGGHAKGNFLLGQVSQDPGVLFYPVTWLYRTSPLVLLGIVALVPALFWLKKSASPAVEAATSSPLARFRPYLPLIIIFILGYALMMTIGEKKQERYLLPVYPWLNLIAAAGLLTLTRLLINKLIHQRKAPPGDAPRSAHHSSLVTPHASLLTLTILLLHGYFIASTFPYYFTYFNPLFGGAKGAEQAITIGWGEGLDLAAAYLNQKPNAAQTRVASWYESTFTPYYKGPAISYSKEKGKALAGDYVIFYINQTQRRFPDEIFFEYYESRFKPEKVISLKGIDYVWIYPSLGVDHYIQDQTYTGIASLLAWQWTGGDRPLVPGRPAEFELYWEYLGKEPDEPFFFRLLDTQGRPWAEALSQPVVTANPLRTGWREGEIIYERGRLTPPPDLPPGQYRLQIGFYTQAPAVKSGELLFNVPPGEDLVTVGQPELPFSYTLPETAVPLNRPFVPPLTLLGASWPSEISQSYHGQAGSLTTSRQTSESLATPLFFPVDLYWRVEQPLPAGTQLHVGLLAANGEPRQAWFNLSLAETFNDEATTWQAGDILHTRWQLDLLPDTPPGSYSLQLVWPEDIAQTLLFGVIEINEDE